MAVNVENVGKLFEDTFIAKSAKIDKLQADRNFLTRKILTLQKELKPLQSAEAQLNQKLNKFQNFQTIKKFVSSDRYQRKDPIETVRPLDGKLPDPDPRLNNIRNQLRRQIEPILKERNRIQAEVKAIQQNIAKYTLEFHTVEIQLNQMGESWGTILAKEGIAKRNYSEVYMLREIHERYKELTTDADGNRKTDDNSVGVRTRNNLILKFRSYAERNPFVLSGLLILNYEDPGADENDTAIEEVMDRLQRVMGDESYNKYDKSIEKYTAKMKGGINDPFISQNVSRQSDYKRVPEENEALVKITETASKIVENFNEGVTNVVNGIIKFFTKKEEEAVESNHRERIRELYGGMAFCDEITPDTETAAKNAQSAAEDEMERLGAVDYAKLFASTQDVVSNDEIESTFNSLLSQVTLAVDNSGGKTISGTEQLTIGNTTYTASLLYHVRILNKARRAVDYLQEQSAKGNIDQDTKSEYIEKVQDEVERSDPEMTVER